MVKVKYLFLAMGVEATVQPTKLEEICSHLQSIREEVDAMKPIPEDAMTYSELKMQLMLNYVANLSYYLSLKHKGESVANHPVFKHLAYLRTFMERLAPLDAALKYQIDKLLLEHATEEEEEEAEAGPNVAAFMPSMSSAVKRITVDQVRKSIEVPMGSGSLEIDPALIAAQIQKAQEKASTKKRAVKTYVEHDSEDDRFDEDEEEPQPPKKTAKKAAKKAASKKTKKVASDDDEEIDSDFEL